MSDSEKKVTHMNTGRPEAGSHYAALYNEALSELSALRDELENEKARIPQYIAERAQTEQHLTAAEQRNAELSALVDRAYELEYIDGDWVDEYRRIKPTESGASE